MVISMFRQFADRTGSDTGSLRTSVSRRPRAFRRRSGIAEAFPGKAAALIIAPGRAAGVGRAILLPGSTAARGNSGRVAGGANPRTLPPQNAAAVATMDDGGHGIADVGCRPRCPACRYR